MVTLNLNSAWDLVTFDAKCASEKADPSAKTIAFSNLKLPPHGGTLYATVELKGEPCELPVLLLATIQCDRNAASARQIRFTHNTSALLVYHAKGGASVQVGDKAPVKMSETDSVPIQSGPGCNPVEIKITQNQAQGRPYVVELLL